MITNRKFAVAFAVSFLIYLLPEILFENAMLYITGGVIGGTISEIFKGSLGRPNNVLVFVVWAVLLVGLVLLYFRFKYKPIKYLILLIIAFFLYIIDNLLAVVPIFETESQQRALIIKFLVIGLLILLKSTTLALIYYKAAENNNNKAP